MIRLALSAAALSAAVLLATGCLVHSNASIAIDPPSGPPGSTFRVDMSDLDEVTAEVGQASVYWDYVPITTTPTPTAPADPIATASYPANADHFSVEVTVPLDAPTGEHEFTVVWLNTESGIIYYKPGTFTVTGATATATVTPTLTPTATPTPTPSPTPSPSPTATPLALAWGDNDCVGVPGPRDALLALLAEAGVAGPAGAVTGCPLVGDEVTAPEGTLAWGDVDCDGFVDWYDAWMLLAHFAGVLPEGQGECPAIGTLLS